MEKKQNKAGSCKKNKIKLLICCNSRKFEREQKQAASHECGCFIVQGQKLLDLKTRLCGFIVIIHYFFSLIASLKFPLLVSAAPTKLLLYLFACDSGTLCAWPGWLKLGLNQKRASV